jgi:hypothetical protein
VRTLEYLLQPGIGPLKTFPNAYVADITYGPMSILYQPFRATGGTLRLTVANDAGFIKATVPPGVRILILPDSVPGNAALAEVMVNGQASYDGSYTSPRLRPGKYRVLATTDLVDRTPECIARIGQARARGQEVEVGPRATASVTFTEAVPLRPADR